MFQTLLRRLELEQVIEFPNYRNELVKLAREKAVTRKAAAARAEFENLKEKEEDAKSGFADELLIQDDIAKPHIK